VERALCRSQNDSKNNKAGMLTPRVDSAASPRTLHAAYISCTARTGSAAPPRALLTPCWPRVSLLLRHRARSTPPTLRRAPARARADSAASARNLRAAYLPL